MDVNPPFQTHFYEILQPENKLGNKWARLCAKAGKNTVSACLNVSISSLALVRFLQSDESDFSKN